MATGSILFWRRGSVGKWFRGSNENGARGQRASVFPRRLRKELEFAYQTQGYETNYDIEVWNINEWYLTKY